MLIASRLHLTDMRLSLGVVDKLARRQLRTQLGGFRLPARRLPGNVKLVAAQCFISVFPSFAFAAARIPPLPQAGLLRP